MSSGTPITPAVTQKIIRLFTQQGLGTAVLAARFGTQSGVIRNIINKYEQEKSKPPVQPPVLNNGCASPM